jgi:phytanoyl-CoA hydroxylase
MNHQVDENQIKFYRENGFIVLDNFLSPDELEHWRETVMNAVRRRKGQKIPGKDAKTGEDDGINEDAKCLIN